MLVREAAGRMLVANHALSCASGGPEGLLSTHDLERNGAMSRLMRGLLGVASIAIVSSSLLAEAAPAGKLSQRIELDLVDAAPADVFGTFAAMLGAELELSALVTGKISVRLQNVTAETALAAVCESIGCRSELKGGERPVLRILPVAPPVSPPIGEAMRQGLESPMSLSLKDAVATDVLDSISRMLQAKLQASGSTHGDGYARAAGRTCAPGSRRGRCAHQDGLGPARGARRRERSSES